MALTRNVNGKVVELTPDEEAQVRAEWAAADQRQAEEDARPKPLTIDEQFAAMKARIEALEARNNAASQAPR